MHAQVASRWAWPNALTVAFFVVLGVVFIRQPFDLDFGWQIRTGERILDTGRLRQPDAFSFTIAGKDIPDHEWLYEVSLALLWRGLGDAGLKWARVLLFIAPVVILAWQLRQRHVPAYAISLTAIIAILIFFFFERLRPLVCSTIGLQLVAGWLHDHCRGRRALDWKLPATMLLWGNLHPAVIMGQALILGAIGWHWLTYLHMRWASAENSQPDSTAFLRLRSLTLWGLLALAATLVAPAPIDRLLYPFSSELRHSAQRLFIEIKPPWHFLTASYAMWLAGSAGILFGVVLLLRRRQFFGWEWALLLGVAGLALAAVRGVGDWLMITAALAVPQIGPALLQLAKARVTSIRPLIQVDRLLKVIFSGAFLRLQHGWVACGLVFITILSVFPWGDHLPQRENADWPRGASDWIAAGKLPGPAPWKIFSGGNEGSYLIWRFNGQARVYCDTRGFYYPGQFLLDGYYLLSGDDEWPARLERVLQNDPEYFLLPVQGGLWQKLEPHVAAPLYQDSKHVILSTAQIRQAAGNAVQPKVATNEAAQSTAQASRP